MGDVSIPEAAAGAGREALAAALAAAAELGAASTAEYLLGALAARYPRAAAGAAAEALRGAVREGRWGAAAYLADYLDQTGPPSRAAGRPLLERRVVAALRPYAITAAIVPAPRPPEAHGAGPPEAHGAGALAPYAITDAIVPAAAPPTEAHGAGALAPHAIRFRHADPAQPAWAFGSPARPSPYFNLGAPAASLRVLQDPLEVVIPQPAIRVEFSYPGGGREEVALRPPPGRGGFRRRDLALAVARQYRRARAGAAPPWPADLAELDLEAVVPRGGGRYGLRVARAEN